MARLGWSLCGLAALLWTAPTLAQGGDEADEGNEGEASEMSTTPNLKPRDVTLTESEGNESFGVDGDPDTEEEEPPAGAAAEKPGTDEKADGDSLAEPPTDDERPFFGVSLGGKGTVGGNVWTQPDSSPSYGLVFDDTAGGWGGGGGLYTELRVLWGYLGLEVDVLFERNSSWHNVTYNGVLETDWILKWTSLRVPILIKGIIPTRPVRISLGVGPEIVAGLGAETELVVKRCEDLVPAEDIEQLSSLFVTEAQTDTYLTADLGLAFEVWQLAITLDLRAGFNLTQPAKHDDRIQYTFSGSPPDVELEQLKIISSNSMDFRLLLGVAWETGFGL
ncbi:MAG: hypothetical protein JRI68_02050 [Deltaproteobacteria bacterium]|nr:hypothetical protein [Deltaproteobacteria bacterium]